jgi:hypothetical protein
LNTALRTLSTVRRAGAVKCGRTMALPMGRGLGTSTQAHARHIGLVVFVLAAAVAVTAVMVVVAGRAFHCWDHLFDSWGDAAGAFDGTGDKGDRGLR